MHVRTLAALNAAALFMFAAPRTALAAEARTYVLPIPVQTSARTGFRSALDLLGAKGVANVRLRSAVADRNDRFVQAAFDAVQGGRAVAGVLFVSLPQSAGAVIDDPNRIAKSFPGLMRRLSAQMPRASRSGGASQMPLHSVSFGSGTIGLPDGWQVLNSYQGCVEAGSTGVHSYLAFGCPQTVFVPPGLPGSNPRATLMMPYGPPAAVLARALAYPPPPGLGLRNVHVVETQPVAGVGGGQSAYVLFDYETQGMKFRGFGLSSVMPIDNGAYVFYKSMFMTPASTFAQLAPTLWRSWQSWGVSSNVLNSRLVSAAQSMREAGDIITGAYWERQHAGATTSLAFDQYIRDVETVEHSSGERRELSYLVGDALVAHDPAHYRLVPTSELIPR